MVCSVGIADNGFTSAAVLDSAVAGGTHNAAIDGDVLPFYGSSICGHSRYSASIDSEQAVVGVDTPIFTGGADDTSVDGEVFSADTGNTFIIVGGGSGNKLSCAVSLTINSQLGEGIIIEIIKALDRILTSCVNGEFRVVAQDEVDVAIIAKLSVQHYIAALDNKRTIEI